MVARFLTQYFSPFLEFPRNAIGCGSDPTQSVASIASVASHVMDIARAEAQKASEFARKSNNEFNIRKQFLDNAVHAIRIATFSQYNIVICTDQAHDDFQQLTGQILPMDVLKLEVAKGKVVNFQVYVFETGRYLRHGKWERDHWWYWGESQKYFDPFAMHVHFDAAQPKLDARQVEAATAAHAIELETMDTYTSRMMLIFTNGMRLLAPDPWEDHNTS